MFSSVILGAVPAKSGASASFTAACGPVIGTVSSRQPRRAATAAASSSEWAEVNSDGSITQRTFSGPMASAAMAATMAESIPPDRPSSALPKPDLPR
jgi:hypothetical protein